MAHEFDKRMDNWRRTVRSPGAASRSCCASWAALYVATRVKAEKDDVYAGPPRAFISIDELDGWLIEAAVRSMTDFDEKQVLRFWYVWQYPEHWIKTKLMLRRTGVKLLLARAEKNLQKVLARLDDPARILSNNSHAGTVPRPESTDALVGAPLTLKKDEALID